MRRPYRRHTDAVTERESALRLRIMRAFAATGAPTGHRRGRRQAAPRLGGPRVVAPTGDAGGQMHMAHPFGAHRAGACVDSMLGARYVTGLTLAG
jgi:hypothetical protein